MLNSFQHLSVAQTPEIDSLLNVLRTAKEDTHKVKTLIELSEKAGWRVGNYDTAFYYAETAKLLAEKLKFQHGAAKAYNAYGIVYWYQGNYSKALENYLSALKILEEIGHRRGAASIYGNIGMIYSNQGKYPEALEKYLAGLKIKEEIGDRVGMANTYNNIGLNLYEQGNYLKALENYLSALKIFEEIGERQWVAVTIDNIGSVYQKQGDYPKSLKNYLAALKIREEIGDQRGLAHSFSNIGSIHYNLENFPQALENFHASLKIEEEIGDRRGLAQSLSNIGNVHFRQHNYPKALKNFLASLNVMEEIGDIRGVAGSYDNIGNVYYKQGNYPKALEEYLAGLKIQEEIGVKDGIAVSYTNIGNLYIKLNKAKESTEWFQKTLALSIEIGNKDHIKSSYAGLAQSDSALGNYKSAYTNYKLYILYRDSLFNEENTKKTTQLEMQYEFNKKEALAQAEQEKKDAITTEQMRRKNQQRNAFLGGFVLMLGLAGVSFRSYRIKKRDNGIITTQKEQVEKKNHEILESINYAKKLQTAVLPPAKVVKEFFSNSLLLYLPRDIVSGDFYWMENKGDTSYFAVADCTGHGVPGAMLSIIGLNGLNRALNEQKLTQPKDILTSLSETVNRHFEKSDATVRDGMDICLCALDNKTKKLTFSGANNPLWIARDNDMLILKGDRRAIGHDDLEQQFTQQEIQLQDGDTVYLVSDGYQDQLGGKKYLKMMTKIFRTRLLALSAKPMEEQRSTLISDLDAWKGTHGQTDDVCVMGIKV